MQIEAKLFIPQEKGGKSNGSSARLDRMSGTSNIQSFKLSSIEL